MTYDKNNVFAKILRREIPTTRIYEDEFVIAFNDIRPKAPTHILIVPKGEYVEFDDMMTRAASDEVLGVFKAVQTVARQNGLHEGGYRLIMNVGAGAGQEVPHMHIHILSNKQA